MSSAPSTPPRGSHPVSRVSRTELVPPVLAAAAAAGVLASFLPRPGSLVLGIVALLLLAVAGVLWRRLHRQVSLIANEWQLTVDAVDFPVITVDESGRVVRLNRTAMEISGRSYQANLGRTLDQVGEGEPWATARDLLPLAGREGVQREVEESLDGRRRVWEVSARSIADAAGARPGFVVLGREVTQRVELEEQLRRQEVMSALGSLVGNVAHEARNPLFALGACADSLQRRYGDGGELGDYLPVLSASVDRLQRLMGALLDYGKPLRPELRRERLLPVVEEARESVREMAAQAGVEVTARVEGDLPPVPIDRERLYQALRNLLENAVQHTPEGGTVALTVRNARGCAEVEVRDAGPGFREEDLPRLFHPFFSRRSGGTGLGLAIVQRVVEQHGGELEPDNPPEGGGRVRLWLPLHPPRD